VTRRSCTEIRARGTLRSGATAVIPAKPAGSGDGPSLPGGRMAPAYMRRLRKPRLSFYRLTGQLFPQQEKLKVECLSADLFVIVLTSLLLSLAEYACLSRHSLMLSRPQS